VNRTNPINRYLFLPDENTDAFFETLHEAFIICQPASQFDATIVVESVKAYWFLQRYIRLVKEYESRLKRQKPDRKTWSCNERSFLTTLRRYRTTAKRSLQHAFNKLMYIQQDHRRWPQFWYRYQCSFESQAAQRKAA
jgi:hypothetical protein